MSSLFLRIYARAVPLAFVLAPGTSVYFGVAAFAAWMLYSATCFAVDALLETTLADVADAVTLPADEVICFAVAGIVL